MAENLRTASLKSEFTGSYKKSVIDAENEHLFVMWLT